jgi:hypothetical protein
MTERGDVLPLDRENDSMPSRFTSRAYEPEMSDALDQAWRDFQPRPKNDELAKSIMAAAIIEAMEAGDREPVDLARKATLALQAAIRIRNC